MDPRTWEQLENPYVILQNTPLNRLEELAKDLHFIEMVEHLAADREAWRRPVSE